MSATPSSLHGPLSFFSSALPPMLRAARHLTLGLSRTRWRDEIFSAFDILIYFYDAH